MSQAVYENEKTTSKKVYYTGSDTLQEGYNLCYDVDYAGSVAADGKTAAATNFNPLRAVRVEKPSVSNQEHYAGVVAPGFAGRTGPTWIEILIPTAAGQKVKIWTEENCTIDSTYLTLKPASYAAGGIGEGRIIAKAMQTVDRSSTNSTVQAQLGGPLTTGDIITLNSRTTVQLPTAAIWDNFPIADMRKNPWLGSLLDTDFTHAGQNEQQKYVDAAEGVYPGATAIGELALFGTTDNQGAEIQWNVPITVSGGTKWGFEARIKASVIGDNLGNIVLGLAAATGIFAGDQITDLGALIDGGFVGFQRKEADGDKIDFVYDEASQTQNEHDADYVTPVANTYNTLGMYFNGTTIQGYLDGVATGTAISAVDIAAADFPTAAVLFPSFYVKNGNAADFTATLDWIRVAQL